MTVSNVYVSEKNKNGILNGSNSHLAMKTKCLLLNRLGITKVDELSKSAFAKYVVFCQRQRSIARQLGL